MKELKKRGPSFPVKITEGNSRPNLGYLQIWKMWPGNGTNFPPENIEGLEVKKVNIEVWRKISHNTKHSDIRFKNLQTWFLKIKTFLFLRFFA